jgi:hypothetical protein
MDALVVGPLLHAERRVALSTREIPARRPTQQATRKAIHLFLETTLPVSRQLLMDAEFRDQDSSQSHLINEYAVVTKASCPIRMDLLPSNGYD